MELAVVGAGHVGTVCASCLAAIGHYEPSMWMSGGLRSLQTPFVEPSLGGLMSTH
jgi:UDP-glucose 6-dehydrogenase